MLPRHVEAEDANNKKHKLIQLDSQNEQEIRKTTAGAFTQNFFSIKQLLV